MYILQNILRMSADLLQRVKLEICPVGSHYSFSMKEIVVLMRGLIFQLGNVFSLSNLIELWGYQTKLVFLTQICTYEDTEKFKRMVFESISQSFPQVYETAMGQDCIYKLNVKNVTESTDYDSMKTPALSITLVDKASLSKLSSEIKIALPDIPKDKLHEFTLLDSIKLSSNLLCNNSNILLVGDFLQNQNEINLISSWLGDYDINSICLKEYHSSELQTTWNMELKSAYLRILTMRRSQIIVVNYQELSYGWLLDDVRCILNKRLPSNILENQDLNYFGTNLNEISALARVSRMLKVVITMQSMAEFEESTSLYPFLRKTCVFHWIDPLNPIISQFLVSELAPNDITGLESQIPKLSELAFSIFKDYDKKSSKTTELIKDYVPAPYDRFCYMIKLYWKIFRRKNADLNSQIVTFNSALSRIEVLLHQLDELEMNFYTCRKVGISILLNIGIK